MGGGPDSPLLFPSFDHETNPVKEELVLTLPGGFSFVQPVPRLQVEGTDPLASKKRSRPEFICLLAVLLAILTRCCGERPAGVERLQEQWSLENERADP
jgi:hypothetical protein